MFFRVIFPIPNPQSPIPNPQSPIPNPQSPIPNPQSPVPSPQSLFPCSTNDLGLLYLHYPHYEFA
ncbi:hypothetical protein ACQFX9_23120 [Aliinostoc sp. HNIBRCY26]|uniref:hypothetical protein n=1 Tax=Aliinostoc sp. HNIBRCY26 TaxID=3418997 RepID=UPI003D00FF07